ncbi:MAG TPA: PaaI family thioesterase [Solirubrobacteraceae bacterium]|nr:PaaI family thioesterase [Solirubrobacteraceae bacterium]
MAIWEEPVRGGHPSPGVEQLPGLERLRAQLNAASNFPSPPLGHLTGMRMVEVGIGSAVFEMPLTGWLRSPQGAISVGPLAIPADAALALAIISTLPAGGQLTTSELSLRMLAPARPGGLVVARGSLLHARRTIALSETTLTDEHGRLLAHGSSLCFILEAADGRPDTATESPQPSQPTDGTPDPWQREPVGEVVPQELWDTRTGLEVLEAIIAGELPGAPIHHLIGIAPTAASEGQATFTMPATRWLCAPPPGRLQGGAVALLAETAVSAAIQTMLPAGTALAPVDLKVNYLRPAASDGRELLAHGIVIHRGRRTAVATSEVVDTDGRRIAIATGSAMVLPGRPAAL